MSKRRTHSSIDRLPRGLQQTIRQMLIDNIWPSDYPSLMDAIEVGKPRYEDVVTYCKHKGFDVSLSAIGRFGKRMRTIARMKQAGVITREVMADISNEKASQTQKAVAEMITAVAIEFISGQEEFTAKQLRDVATAMRDCTSIAINSDRYVRDQIEVKVKAAAEGTRKKLKKAGVDRKVIQEIIDEHLGVTKS